MNRETGPVGKIAGDLFRHEGARIVAMLANHLGVHRLELAEEIVECLDLVGDRISAGNIEPSLDHITLGRSDHDGRDHFFPFKPANIGADQLDRVPADTQVEGPAVGDVGQKKADDVATASR